MPKLKDEYFCYLVAYINSDHLNLVRPQLLRHAEFLEVEAYIPTIKILKKQFKGQDHFDEVPLLFNYGFFKVPRKYAIHKNYLDSLQQNVSAIHGWVKDPAKGIKGDKLWEEFPDLDLDRKVPIATASSEEIAELIKASLNVGAHSADDLAMIKAGDLITLRGYPFDGLEAEFVSLDEKRKKVLVKMQGLWNKEVEVAFDNVFFTIYHGRRYDETLNADKSLDEMESKHSLDHLISKIHKRNEE